MKRVRVVVAAALMGAGDAGLALAAEPLHEEKQERAGALPGALDELYPPRAKQPVYLMAMLQLDSLLSGFMVDLSEGDTKGAGESLAAFKAQYAKVSELVPEWTHLYPAEPVAQLEAAVREGDRDKTMAAYGRIGRSCHACHAATMVAVQQKFRWGDISAITPRDPFLNQTTDYASFKRHLSTSFTGIGHNLRQGQLDNARTQFRQFSARFKVLRGTCVECHDQESRHYVDREAQKRIESLGEVLAGTAVDPNRVIPLLQNIGQESCAKCHLVHVPAAGAPKARRN